MSGSSGSEALELSDGAGEGVHAGAVEAVEDHLNELEGLMEGFDTGRKERAEGSVSMMPMPMKGKKVGERKDATHSVNLNHERRSRKTPLRLSTIPFPTVLILAGLLGPPDDDNPDWVKME